MIFEFKHWYSETSGKHIFYKKFQAAGDIVNNNCILICVVCLLLGTIKPLIGWNVQTSLIFYLSNLIKFDEKYI